MQQKSILTHETHRQDLAGIQGQKFVPRKCPKKLVERRIGKTFAETVQTMKSQDVNAYFHKTSRGGAANGLFLPDIFFSNLYKQRQDVGDTPVEYSVLQKMQLKFNPMKQLVLSNIFVIFYCSLLLFACNQKLNKEENYLKKATLLHNEAVELQTKVAQKIAVYEQSIQRLATELPGAENLQKIHLLKDSLKAVKDTYHTWQKNLVEVPGNEHASHEGHHHHETPVEIPAEDMWAIQKQGKENIQRLYQRIERHMAQLKK